MTREQALAELIAKVEASTLNSVDLICLEAEQHAWAWRAYNYGSLDAALELHEAVLPDLGWDVEWVAKYPGLAFKPAAFTATVGWGMVHRAYADTPARAWLLALLRALLSEAENEHL